MNGMVMNRDYGTKDRLSILRFTHSADTLEYSFDYDRSDNITRKNSDYFGYDAKGQLTSASVTSEAANTPYPYTETSTEMEAQPDILNDEVLILSEADLSLD